jgi:hypothetical protein
MAQNKISRRSFLRGAGIRNHRSRQLHGTLCSRL